MAEKELIDVTLPNGSVLTNVPFGSTQEQVKNAAIKLGLAEVLDFKAAAESEEIVSRLVRANEKRSHWRNND